MANLEFIIENEGRLTKDEWYGPMWKVAVPDKKGKPGTVILIPDPGDESALPLARYVVELLNRSGTESACLPKW